MDMERDDRRPLNFRGCGVCHSVGCHLPLWMSEVQLAKYWSLFDERGEPLIDEIRAWSERPAAEHKLYYARMGAHRRYYRPVADEWAWEEYELQRDNDYQSDSSSEPESDLPN
jgi:hypothetical protein